jgi:hypothetical protein
MWLSAPPNIWRSSMQALDSNWRPRRDLNPCYRRESGRTPGNLLKLGGMDSAVRHFQEPSEPLIGRLLEQRSEVLWSQFNGTRTSDNSRISP